MHKCIALKSILKFTLKQLLHVSVHSPSSGCELFELAKVIIFIINIQPLVQFGQEPEPSQATGMALVRCIPGKFLGVVSHCFPPRLDVPTFAARCLHVRNDAKDPSSAKHYPVILPTWRLYSRH
jgi:hypothetical protein